MENNLETAIKTCKELAQVLDARLDARYDKYFLHIEDMDEECLAALNSATEVLSKMPLDIFFVAAKTELGIERIVRGALDEHKEFWKIMSKVDKIILDAGLPAGLPVEKYIEALKDHEQRENTNNAQPSGELTDPPTSLV